MTNDTYRLSHQAPGHGKVYDETLYSPGTYDSEIWSVEQECLRDLVSELFPRGIERLLDFACGTGRITSLMAQWASETTGLDISEEMLSVARTRVPRAKFVRGDVTRESDLASEMGKYDCITSFRFFLNAEPSLRDDALRALVPLLSDDGYLLVSNHGNDESLLSLVMPVRRWLGKPLQKTLPCSEFVELLTRHELRVERVVSVCFSPRIVARALPRRVWRKAEAILSSVPALRRYGIYQIYVCTRAPRT